jgi:DUF4097 and DUF4098 domain-containing protein YvlB
VKAAEQTRVECSGGTLSVRGPKSRMLDFSRKARSVDVTLAVPTGSRLHAEAAMADVLGDGRLSECTVDVSAGHLQLDEAESARLHTGAGNISLEHAADRCDISTGSGKVRLGRLDAGGTIKNSNGTTEVAAVSGHLVVRAANGDIAVGASTDGLEAKTANGSIRVDEAVQGSVVLETSMGDLEIGIGHGVAAWLDVKTKFGHVHQRLADAAGEPSDRDRTVQVRARTWFGDITVRRA